jgi:hypothetical protein
MKLAFPSQLLAVLSHSGYARKSIVAGLASLAVPYVSAQ